MGLRLLSGHGAWPGPGRYPFEQARARFEAAWRLIRPTVSDANFQEWRDQRDWTAKKYAMWARGELMPSQTPNSMMGCACGARFDSHDPAGSYEHRRHIYAVQSAEGILH
jgi:hypothetical protein